ncbi:MAG: sodium-dependent transporter [Coriobacteriia bacterium]|nr:sodium-dependent transporter [Coriobacteriia bacterium]
MAKEKEMGAMRPRSKFTGSIGFILAAAASAIGLGNLWRFPYLAAQYGGGVFLVTYLVLVFTVGFTLSLTENTLGRMTGKSAIGAFSEFGKKFVWIGALISIVPMIIFPYYSVIGGWVLKYFSMYITGQHAAVLNPDYFGGFITSTGEPIVWGLIFMFIAVFVVAKGVEGGIERVNSVMMPLLFVLLIVISVVGLMLPGALDGLYYYLVPDFSKFSVEMVLQALGQMFYSLSLAMAILITYGSYTPKDVNLEKSVARAAGLDTLVAIFAGLMIIPAVFAVLGADGVTSGPGLMFVTLPGVFESTPIPNVVGMLFFLLVFFAAVTSAISLLEAVVSIFMDALNIGRAKAVVISTVISTVLLVLSAAGYGVLGDFTLLNLQMLDFFDFISNSIIMPIGAVLTLVFVGYVVGLPKVSEEIEVSGEFKTRPVYTVMVKYVAPIFIAAILVFNVVNWLGA